MQRDLKIHFIFIIFVILIFVPGASALPVTETSVPVNQLFTPDRLSIHSDRINDMANGPNGEILVATDYGLSFFTGTWTTWHHDPAIQNKSRDLLNDVVLAAEYDNLGRLWLGYPSGLQIWDGRVFTTIDDVQILKDPRVQHLQRWDDTMWIATGKSGIHRYYDGTDTWYQPLSKNGPGFYEVNSMTLDAGSNTLLVASVNEGPWAVRDNQGTVSFAPLADPGSAYYTLNQVRRDPNGGAFFFNDGMIAHYDGSAGFRPVLTGPDIAQPTVEINDIAAATDGTLYIATNSGIYRWYDGAVSQHISGFSGIGESSIIRTLFLDAAGRLWFSGQGFVGYFVPESSQSSLLSIQRPESSPGNQVQSRTSSPTGTLPVQETGTARPATTDSGSGSILGLIGNAFSDFLKAVMNLFNPSGG